MTTRLARRFAALAAADRAGLVAYVMGGDPDLATSFEVLRGLPAAGVDVVELGFPFSDPMADGPTIQRAGQRALAAGVTLAAVLDLARRFRAEDGDTPLVLMGYLNPLEQMGYARFAAAAAQSGVDGVIVVDLPPEEDREFREALAAQGIAFVRLATPTTDNVRLARILDGAGGFLYYVSVTGVTGAAAAREDAGAAVRRLKAQANGLPVAVGFGVRDGATAARLALAADAVVVGSAFVEAIAEAVTAGATEDAPARVFERVNVLAQAVHAARRPGGA